MLIFYPAGSATNKVSHMVGLNYQSWKLHYWKLQLSLHVIYEQSATVFSGLLHQFLSPEKDTHIHLFNKGGKEDLRNEDFIHLIVIRIQIPEQIKQ